MERVMKEIAHKTNLFEKKQQCHRSARNIFTIPLFASAKYLAIGLSCKENERNANQLLIERVYVKCLECNDQVFVNVKKAFHKICVNILHIVNLL